MYLWFFMALGAALFWAVALILLKKGFENISPLWNNIIGNIMLLFIWVPAVSWLSKFTFKTPSLSILIVILVGASFYMFFPYTISKGNISLTGTLISTTPALTVVLSYIFLKERVTQIQLIGIALVILGGLLISLPEKKFIKKSKDFSWISWALAYILFCGTGDFLTKVSTNAIGAHSSILFFSLMYQPLSAINYLIDKKGRKLPKFSKKKFWPTIAGNFILLSGSLMYYLAFGYGNVSLIAPTTSIYPAIMAVLAAIFLREKITVRQGLGISAVVLGVVMIGLGNS